MSSSTELDRVRELVAPIASDLQLDLYDVERRGGTVRVTLDTPPGSPGGVTLDDLSLATRLIGRELDHEDPINGKYTLEVTSPGLERNLRSPQHFVREVGKQITVRLRNVVDGERRVDGLLLEAGDAEFVLVGADGAQRTLRYDIVDKARTVFEWGPKPKPGKGGPKKKTAASPKAAAEQSATSPVAKQAAASSQPHHTGSDPS